MAKQKEEKKQNAEIRLPRHSRWGESVDSFDRTVITQTGKMDSLQFWGGLLFLASFTLFFVFLVIDLVSRFPSVGEWSIALWRQNSEFFFVSYLLIPVGITEIVACAYFYHEVGKAFKTRRWTFDKNSAVYQSQLGWFKRTIRYDLSNLRQFDIRPYWSWFDQFNMDYDSRLGLTFQDEQGKSLAKIYKLTLPEAKWIIQLCKPVYVLPDDIDKTGVISIALRNIRTPKTFVCSEKSMRFSWRYFQWKTWPLWIIFSIAVPVLAVGCYLSPYMMFSIEKQEEFAYAMPGFPPLVFFCFIPWILAIPVFALVLYHVFGKESGNLDSSGFRYVKSVIIPIYYRSIPLDDLTGFSIVPIKDYTTGIQVSIRNQQPFTCIHVSSFGGDCDVHDWIKRNGNRIIKELTGKSS